MTHDDVIQCTGEGNQLGFADESSVRFINSSIRVSGHGNRILIGEGVVLNGFHIQIESHQNEIVIGPRSRLTGKVIMKLSDGNRLLVGENTSVGGCNFICGESSSIKIGKDCMLSWGIEMRTTDSHAIFDRATGCRINAADDIELGDHIWVGAQATLLKGAFIASGSVVGIRSVVSDVFDETHVILAGVPARIVRRDVEWKRPLLG